MKWVTLTLDHRKWDIHNIIPISHRKWEIHNIIIIRPNFIIDLIDLIWTEMTIET